MSTASNQQQHQKVSEEVWVKVAVMGALVLLAPLAFIASFLFRRFVGQVPRSTRWMYWAGALGVGGVGCLLVYVFGHFDLSVLAAIDAWVAGIEHHRWNAGLLIVLTAIVWLKSIFAAPFISAFQMIFKGAKTEDTLNQQVRDRQVNLAKVAAKAEKRTSDAAKMPELLDGQIVLGVPLHDPDEENW
ncbi:MAG: hypothetical protein ABI413_11450 [Ktedonobacteraceae bacterium]